MAEFSKYDLFMNELISLEKELYAFIQERDDLREEKESLLERIEELEKENTELKAKHSEMLAKFNNIDSDSFIFSGDEFSSPEEREKIKNRINELISKIDSHLRS